MFSGSNCFAVLWIRIRIRRIRMFLGFPGSGPVIFCTDPDLDNSINEQKRVRITLISPIFDFLSFIFTVLSQDKNLFFLKDLLVLWIRNVLCHLSTAQKTNCFAVLLIRIRRIRMFLGFSDSSFFYGSGSFHPQAKKVRKTLISPIFFIFYL